MIFYCGIVCDPKRSQARVLGRKVTLSTRRLRLLSILLRYPGRVFSKDELMKELRLKKTSGDNRVIKSCVQQLRQKLFPRNKKLGILLIRTQHGKGYFIPTEEVFKASLDELLQNSED